MASQTKIAGIKNFYRGDTRKYKVTVRNKLDQTPISVDGGKLTITFKSKKNQDDNLAAIQVVTNATEADPQNPTGEIYAVLEATDTDVTPGSYYYDFQFTSAAGEVTTLLPTEDQEDRVTILEDITRTT